MPEAQLLENVRLTDTSIKNNLASFDQRLILRGDPLIAPVLNEHETRRLVGLTDIMIGRQWRVDFLGRKEPEFTVSLQRGAVAASNVCPEAEQETCTVFERTGEIAV